MAICLSHASNSAIISLSSSLSGIEAGAASCFERQSRDHSHATKCWSTCINRRAVPQPPAAGGYGAAAVGGAGGPAGAVGAAGPQHGAEAATAAGKGASGQVMESSSGTSFCFSQLQGAHVYSVSGLYSVSAVRCMQAMKASAMGAASAVRHEPPTPVDPKSLARAFRSISCPVRFSVMHVNAMILIWPIIVGWQNHACV